MEIDDRVTISTPEGVDVELVVAGLGSRFMSSTVDTLLQVLLIIPFALAAGVTADPGLGVAVASVSGFLVIFGFPTVFDAFLGGRTPGRRVAGLRLVTTEGGTVGFVAAAVRNIVRILDFLPGAYVVGTFACLLSERTQRVGDMAAGTLVVRMSSVAPAQRAAVPGSTRPDPVVGVTGGTDGGVPMSEGVPSGWDLTGVTDADLSVVRAFLGRRHSLDPRTRSKLAADLARRLEPVVVGPLRSQGDEFFLESVLMAKDASRP